jgi:hypothetical protein
MQPAGGSLHRDRLHVTVRGTVAVAGRAVTLAEVTRRAETTYPNGPQCGPGGNQLAITIDQAGIP